MDRETFQEAFDAPDRNALIGKINKLRRRLGEAQALDMSSADPERLHGLEVGILLTLSDAFGQNSSAFRQFSAAAELGSGRSSLRPLIGDRARAKLRAIALLERAILTKEEEFEDKYPGYTLPHAPDGPMKTAGDSTSETGAGATLDAARIDGMMLDGGPVNPQGQATGGGVSAVGAVGDPRIAMAGVGQAGAMIMGFSGDHTQEDPGEDNPRPDSNAVFGFAEASIARPDATDLLAARIAVLRAALSAPKPPAERPIGLGHNGPPDFDPPMSEDEIQALIKAFRGPAAGASVDPVELLDITRSAQAKASQFRQRVDEFTGAAVKGAGGEVGKRLAQLPWWMAVYAALNGVLEAAAAWISSLPMP